MNLKSIILNEKLITETQYQEAKRNAEQKKITFLESIVDMGFSDEDKLFGTVAKALEIPYINFSNFDVDTNACRMISERIARRNRLIPVGIENGELLVAMANPMDILAVEDVRIMSGMRVQTAISSKAAIERAINLHYNSTADTEKAVHEFSQQVMPQEKKEEPEKAADIENAPVVRIVKSLLVDAVKTKTSDIHIEPFENSVRIRYRIDGELKEITTLPKTIHSGLVTRIKIIGEMDISERKIPQDGRVGMRVEEKEIDMRISVIPTVYGEKIVIRLLDKSGVIATKESLGFTDHNMQLLEKIMKVPEGMILLTGPTGSGKTTTLYALLRELNNITRNIVTLEDPVEYKLHGINQVQVNNKVGMTFAGGLRSILRQDPDVVMLGEIRDEETAQIAVRAAITGHIVLSTLHTNDTASTISRLVDMGVKKYMVSSAVVGVIAQRLVKRICPKCKEEYIPTLREMLLLGLEHPQYLYKGAGCNFCGGSGYAGRMAIHEILVFDEEIRKMIDSEAPIDSIKTEARKRGLRTLNESARELVLRGDTTMEQMTKITYTLDS